MNKIIYISSPYSDQDSLTVEENYQKVSMYVSKLISEGFVTISHITYGHTLVGFHSMPTDWDFWRNFCLSVLNICDEMHVYMLNGWNESKGVKEEIQYAKSIGIEIKYIPHEEEKIEDREMIQEEKNSPTFENIESITENLPPDQEKSAPFKYFVTTTAGDKIKIIYG